MMICYKSCYSKIILLWLFFVSGLSYGQKKSPAISAPKLVVGIVVDQMRYDYLYKYWDKYGDGGFKRLLREGYNCKNTHYNYVPTYTGPGHAAIYTGTTPSVNGIIANDWYNREKGRSVYVTEDTTAAAVGISTTATEGKMSPANLLSTTVGDELRLFNNMQSKVMGIALKDRGAILPAGHLGNAAYWYDGKSGKWISSSYYMKELPEWVTKFNEKKLPDQYLSKEWNTLLPIEKYTESLPDSQLYKLAYSGETVNRFPHKINELKSKLGYSLLRSTPMGNTFTLDFALELLEAERLGQGTVTDFFTLSFSSTDYVGHQFGVHSIEVEDTYLRLDKEIERLLKFLDQKLGKENVLLFMTADHGGAYTPKYLQSINIPAGIFNARIDSLKSYLSSTYGIGQWILNYDNGQLYLNHSLMKSKGVEEAMKNSCVQYFSNLNGVVQVLKTNSMSEEMLSDKHISQLRNGINLKRSGDIIIMLEPGWLEGEYLKNGGTSHGSGYTYDTHIPLLWYGWKVKKGESALPVMITDIAPTVAGMLNITAPNGTIGTSREDLIKVTVK